MLAILTWCGSAGAQCQYTVQDWGEHQCIGPGSGGTESYTGTGLNNLGGWCGYRFMCYWAEGEGSMAVYRPAGGTPQTLPLPSEAGEDGARASCINDHGDIGGMFRTAPHDLDVACVWWHNGTITVIPPPPGGDRSYASAINNSGTVVGYRFTPDTSRPFLWRRGELIDIDTLDASDGYALAVTEGDTVVGYLWTDIAASRAYIWKEGMTTLLEPCCGHASSVASDVNATGIVVGASQTYVPTTGYTLSTPTLWIDHQPVTLPLPSGFSFGAARRINDAGVIMGSAQSSSSSGPFVTVAWINGQVYLLDDLAAPTTLPIGLLDLAALNDTGQILTRGLAALVTPVGQSLADLNGDCAVDGSDLTVVLSEWGPREWSIADINEDRMVDGNDLAIVLGHWAPAAAPSAPPGR